MLEPTRERAEEICMDGKYCRIPVKLEMPADMLTPVMALRKLKKVSRNCFLLETGEGPERKGRYTFLGCNPVMEIICGDGILCQKNRDGTEETVVTDKPQQILRDLLKDFHSPRIEGMPSFTGGLVGCFSYEYLKYAEPTQNDSSEEDFPDLNFGVFDEVVVFDHDRQKIMLILNIETPNSKKSNSETLNSETSNPKTKNLEMEYIRAERELHELAMVLLKGEDVQNFPLKLKTKFMPLFEKEEYCKMVEKGKRRILEGDIFQVVLSNRMEAEIEGSLLDTYRVLRTTNPSPYMFYFADDSMEIAGASPETLVKQKGEELWTYPLAGSRPRGKTRKEDLEMESELQQDEKERAEHNMLVDLGRNDLGRISRIGSVGVEQYMETKRFSHIMHLSSAVHSRIRPDKDALDAISSVLPAGTLSGAPKLRACEIIRELEQTKRGIYGGAIGYLDFNGDMDTCIGIRLAFARKNKVYIQAGAGIVADSIPEKEYQECENKAKAVIQALKMAEGGIDP